MKLNICYQFAKWATDFVMTNTSMVTGIKEFAIIDHDDEAFMNSRKT